MMRTSLYVGGVLLVCGAVMAAPHAINYTNPVWPHDAPDPTVWEGDGHYYCASTHQEVLESEDLVHWKSTGRKLLEDAEYAWIHKRWPNVWAPDVVKTSDGYSLYLCFHRGGEHTAIAAYRAKSAAGPFTDRSIILTSEGVGKMEVIDPEVVRDSDGRLWLFFGHGAVRRVELDADGRRLKEDAKIEHVAGIPWNERGERKYFSAACSTEAPYLYFRQGKWYLFISQGSWVDHSYQVAVGRADALGGRFFDKDGRPMSMGFATPILTSEKGDVFFGPGHNGEILTMPSGHTYMFYHCHWTGSPDAKPGSGYVPRPLFLQEILWSKDGWPYFANGGKPQKDCVLKHSKSVELGEAEHKPKTNAVKHQSIGTVEGSGFAMAELKPLPEFRFVPYLDARCSYEDDLCRVEIGAYDREGHLCSNRTDEVTAVPAGNAPCTVIGTNVFRLAGGKATLLVRRPPQGQKVQTRLKLNPSTDDLLGANLLLRRPEDVPGVWKRDEHGGASYEVPAAWVTNEFAIATACPKVFGLFDDPKEPLALEVMYRHTGSIVREVILGCRVYDWDGKDVPLTFRSGGRGAPALPSGAMVENMRPESAIKLMVSFNPPEERGIWFVEPYLRDANSGRELAFARTHLTRLPPHAFKATAENSIFGLAAYRGYPTHADAQRLIDRLGVRWIRTDGDLRIQHPGRRVNYLNALNWKSNVMWPERERDNWVREQMEFCTVHGCDNFEFGNEMNLAVATIGEAMDGIGLCHYAAPYVSWVKTFDRVMKANGYDRNVNLLGFGMAGFDHAFATKMREAGILPMLKGFCIHPPTSQFTPDFPYQADGKYGPPERAVGPHPADYPTPGSETNCYWNFLGSIRAAKDFLAKYAPEMPLYVTEMYSSSFPNFIWGPSMRDGADNVMLEYALLKAEGVKVGFYYKLYDGTYWDYCGINPKDREYTFGLLNRDLSLKPAALAYAAIAEALDEAEFLGWMKMADPKTHGLLFKTPRGPMAILWARWDGLFVSRRDPDGITRDREPWLDRWLTKKLVALPAAGRISRIDEIGRVRSIDPSDGRVKLPLGGSPCIVYGLDAKKIELH